MLASAFVRPLFVPASENLFFFSTDSLPILY